MNGLIRWIDCLFFFADASTPSTNHVHPCPQQHFLARCLFEVMQPLPKDLMPKFFFFSIRIPIANLFLTRRKRNTDDVQDEVPSPLAALKKMGPLLSTLVPPLVINATIDDFNVQFTNATSRSLNVTQALLKSSTTTLAPSTTAKIADLWSDYDIADYDYDAAAYEEEFDEEFEKTFYETDDEVRTEVA